MCMKSAKWSCFKPCFFHIFSGSLVTLVVAFAFLLPNFWKWWEPTNGTLLPSALTGDGDGKRSHSCPSHLVKISLTIVFFLNRMVSAHRMA